MRRALVTGGLGFIGSYTVARLLADGWSVDVVDDCSSNAVNVSHPSVCGAYTVRDSLQYVAGDLPDDYDVVFHLASPVGPVGVLKWCGMMARQIIDDTYAAVDVAQESNARLVYVSTSEVYGHRDGVTYLREDGDKVLRGDFTVRNEYAVAKLLGEITVTNLGRRDTSFEYQIVRPFNVTGALQMPDNGFVLPRFTRQALGDEPVTVYFDGSQRRAFTHVDDIVDGLMRVAEAPSELQRREWNIGNRANEISIGELARKVIDTAESDSQIVHVDPRELHGDWFSESPEKIPDATAIESLLGWSPRWGVDAIVADVLAHERHVAGLD